MKDAILESVLKFYKRKPRPTDYTRGYKEGREDFLSASIKIYGKTTPQIRKIAQRLDVKPKGLRAINEYAGEYNFTDPCFPNESIEYLSAYNHASEKGLYTAFQVFGTITPEMGLIVHELRIKPRYFREMIEDAALKKIINDSEIDNVIKALDNAYHG